VACQEGPMMFFRHWFYTVDQLLIVLACFLLLITGDSFGYMG